MKHGDDWELVAQNIPTKTKLDCISKLIELPFGELMLSSVHGSDNFAGSSGTVDGTKNVTLPSFEHQESIKGGDPDHEQINDNELNGGAASEEPLLKRRQVALPSDAGSSLMNQVRCPCQESNHEYLLFSPCIMITFNCFSSFFLKLGEVCALW